MSTQGRAQFTPGPWTVQVFSDETVEMRIKAGTEVIAHVCDIGNYRIVEQEATANLMAAAPAMYKALKALYDGILFNRGASMPEARWQVLTNIARQTLAKAEGR